MRCHFTLTRMTGQKKIVARVEDVEKTGYSDIASECQWPLWKAV